MYACIDYDNTYNYDLFQVGDLHTMTYEIRSGRKNFRYNIEGIKKGSRYNQDERRELLLQIIAKNPDIMHTHVIKLTYQLSGTAKKTVELELSRLEQDGLLESIKLSDSPNALRMWELKVLEMPIDKTTKSNVDKLLSSLNNSIVQLTKKYHAFTIEKKAKTLALLLISLNDCQPLFAIGGKIIESEKRKKEFQILLNRVYEILLSDKDFHKIQPLIIKYIHGKAIQSDKKYEDVLFKKSGYSSK